MTSTVLRIADQFSRTPGPRYAREGDLSGETFRREVLRSHIQNAIVSKTHLLVDLDGTAGYGTSFLEEAFGGLVREDGFSAVSLRASLDFKSVEEDYLIEDIWTYIDEAQERKK